MARGGARLVPDSDFDGPWKEALDLYFAECMALLRGHSPWPGARSTPTMSSYPADRVVATVVRGADLPPSERRSIVALCSRAFSEEFDTLFSLWRDPVHVLVRVDGALVAHACWVRRWLQPEGSAPLRTAYVEAVATDPAHQGRGYGTLAMRRVAEEVRGYPLAGLSTGSQGFYARLGWELWQGPTAIRTPSGLLDTTGESVMILRTPLTPPLDVRTLLTAEWREGELW